MGALSNPVLLFFLAGWVVFIVVMMVLIRRNSRRTPIDPEREREEMKRRLGRR
jgi:hypothetical protein